jgi:hypothetical protein
MRRIILINTSDRQNKTLIPALEQKGYLIAVPSDPDEEDRLSQEDFVQVVILGAQ